jgi:phosphate transport system permease protein
VTTPKSTAPKPRPGGSSGGDAIFKNIIIGLASVVLLVIVLYAWQLLSGGFSAFTNDLFGFLFGSDWDPANDKFSGWIFIVGTFLTSFGALLIAVPLSVAAALFVTEYAPPWLANPVGYMIELLAAIPSVIYGLWGIFVLVPLVRSVQVWLATTLNLPDTWKAFAYLGNGLFAAVLVLSIMIIPFIASISRDVIRYVPNDQREAAYALGATKWEVIRTGILPYARAGILGGVILGLGRAIGETLAVTMVIGNATRLADTLFSPTATMASIIASNFAEATTDNFRSSLVAIGFLLLVFSLIINLVARIVIIRLTPQGTRL